MPRLMMFTPLAMASCFILSIAANKYGGNVLIRVAYSMGNVGHTEKLLSPFLSTQDIAGSLDSGLVLTGHGQASRRHWAHSPCASALHYSQPAGYFRNRVAINLGEKVDGRPATPPCDAWQKDEKELRS